MPSFVYSEISHFLIAEVQNDYIFVDDDDDDDNNYYVYDNKK